MPGLIRPSDIEEVKARTNIADVVGDYVALKSAGVGSMKGLCPFHDERSPSFHVRPAAGFYHCFGCGESGDVYTFLQRMDHVTFAEAVERLAAKAGYPLQYEDGRASADTGARARVLKALDAAEVFFTEQLSQGGAAPGRRFLAERGFDAQAAARFGVGYAPKSWNELTDALAAKGFSGEELAAAGLVSAGDRGSYDRFRGRVMWPIRDVTGQTVGFGARRLFDDDKGPKYLNTPETSVYHKAQVLYGLDLAKRDISRGRRVVVVEGYTDVMACHLAGVTTAVATCGTSFGLEHIRVLRRVLGDDDGAGEVIFTFDPDAAGEKAAMRAFAEEQRFAAQTYVATGPDGLDPCDLRLAQGDDAVVRMIDDKKPMFEFMLRQVLGRFDLDTVEGRIGALRAAAPVVADIRDRALQPGYVRRLAGMLGLDLDEVGGAVRQAARAPRTEERRAPDGDDGQSGSAVAAGPSMADLGADPVTRLERDAVMALLQLPQLVGAELAMRAATTPFTNATLQVVRDGVAANLHRIGDAGYLTAVVDEVPLPFAGLVRQLGVAPIPERDEAALAGYATGIVSALVDRGILARKVDLVGRLQRTDPADREAFGALQRQLVDLDAERRVLRGA